MAEHLRAGGGNLVALRGKQVWRRSAGAETLVTSLWRIDDRLTQELMGHFYDNLLHGMGRVRAMQEAAGRVRTRYPHPYFWAPFIVLGQDAPLRGAWYDWGRSGAR